jgi:hypothetical protein
MRGAEPSDAGTFARRNLDGEAAHYGMLKGEWEQSAHRI